ncbi:extracellular solute-binding protein [Gracilibacillus timonensis]|uniref:extracellular solute-binding protein n=1 Tax=Gracilibacillus timonensis TaxID=1816696 RepID=UPI0008241E89|nr:extracellular solute-binding protein [Gracilibacillus timonensis]
MKKIMILLVGLILTSILLGACSSEDSGNSEVPEGATEVVLWNPFSGGDGEYFEGLVEKFNDDQSDIFVNSVFQDNEEYYTKLITSLSAGEGPDIAVAHTHVLSELINGDLIVGMDELASEEGLDWDEFNQNILDATVFNGEHYAVPMDTHALIMFQNNELLREADLLNDDGSIKMEETPEGFIEFLTQLKEDLPDGKIPFAFGSEGGGLYWLWWAYYSQLGGEGIVSEDPDNPEYVLDLEKGIEAANYIKNFFDEELIPLNLASPSSEFESGNAAIVSSGVWDTGLFEKSEELDFTPLPIPNVFEQNGTWGDSHTLVLPNSQDTDEEVQKVAVQFMDFITDNGVDWAEAGHIPAKTTVVESDAFKEMPNSSEYSEVADYVNFADRTVHARGLEDIIARNLDKLWSDEATAEEAFSDLETEVKELINE